MGVILKEDIDYVLSDGNIPWSAFHGSTVLVTGATGLIGGVLVHALSAAKEKYNLDMRIIAHGRNCEKGEALAYRLGLDYFGSDICKPIITENIGDKVDYIFHCAAITKSADMVEKPVDVMSTAVDGTHNTLELARMARCKGFVYVSSMEIYGQTEKREIRENDLGYLDLSITRNSYPESKRMCEMLCVAYAAQYGLPVKIARLARTFGAGTPNDDCDKRVANQFARKALAGEDIELHTMGNSTANCCYTFDAVRGLLTVLLKGNTGEAYNIVNPAASATISEMADIVANDVCGGIIKVVVNIPNDIERCGYAPDVGYILNADKLMSLGWSPRYGLAEMYRRMLADWQGQ